MKALRKFLDKIKPNFEEGGKFSKLHSVFEGFETFLFVPDKVTNKGAHIRDAIDLKRTMIIVVMSVIPAMLFGVWNVGYQHYLAIGEQGTFFELFWFGLIKFLPLLIVSYVVGLGIEFVFAQIRGHEINEGFLVSGILIPLIVPINIPLWMLAVAVAFAVIIGKEVFGGTGMNIWNPALIARAFLFFAYPSEMSGDKVWVEGLRNIDPSKLVDGFSGATPLAQFAAEGGDATGKLVDGLGNNLSVFDMFMGWIPGSIGETSTIAILIGAAILIYTGIGSFKIMISTVAGGLAMGFLLNILGPETNVYMQIPPYYHLIIGGFAFGAIFMATDPVSAAQTSTGKIIYGFLIGIIAVLIRVLNPAYPEGMMLSILLMNTFAPLIDHYVVQSNIKRRLKRVKKLA